jgi:hypothetical protein
MPLAVKIYIPFVPPIREEGKLLAKTVQPSYSLEYGLQ